MFGKGWRLFSLSGFEVRLDPSWLVLAVLVAWSLATYFPTVVHGYAPITYWAMGIATTAGLFVSIVLHEFAHSVVARRHDLPMRGITLFIFGGVAEMGSEPPSATAEFRMAAAGPALSVVLGLVLLGVNALAATVSPAPVRAVVDYLGSLNLMLAAFNLIPAFPLDGGRVLRAILWRRSGNLTTATRTASRIGTGFGVVLMVLGAIVFLSGLIVQGIWYFVLGMFLRRLAAESYQQVLMRRALEGEPVRRFMTTDVVTIPPTATVQELVDDYVYRSHHKLYPVVDGGRLQGCVTTERIRTIPREEWGRRHVSDIAAHCSPDNSIAPDADAMQALDQMRRARTSRLLVASDGRLDGILTLKDLLAFFALKVELEP